MAGGARKRAAVAAALKERLCLRALACAVGLRNNQSRLRFLITWYNAPPPPPISAPAAAPLPPPAAAPMPAPMAAGAAIVKTVFSLESPLRLTREPDGR